MIGYRISAVLAIMSISLPVSAATTMESIWTEKHATPASFSADGNGGFIGYTSVGEPFAQTPLLSADATIQIHKFTIGTAYFYVSDRGFIKASSDLVAVSMYLSRA